MNDEKKAFLLLALIGAMILFASQAHAEIGPPVTHPSTASTVVTGDMQSKAGQSPMHEIRSAVGRLEQAALESDFASNTQVLALLQTAHDRLGSAIKSLCCAQRARAVQLQSDIEHVIVRDSARLGPLVSTDGDTFGPPAPTRNQLAQLATEGQDLMRDAPIVHRPVDTDAFDTTNQETGDTRSRARQDPMDLAKADVLSWPGDRAVPSPQFHFQF